MSESGEVLAVRLPIPLDAMATIQEFVERVYGTGETSLRMNGDQMSIIAPENGWGPRKRGRGRLPSASNDAMRLRYASLRDDQASLTVEDTEYTILLIAEIARHWFELTGGINYVETKLIAQQAGEPEFVFTMQRIDGKTPHELREDVERRLKECEAELAALRGDLEAAGSR